MTSAPGSRTQVMDPRTGSLPRLLWSPDDTDPGWFHTAEWELAEDWDAPAAAEWAQPSQVIDITDAAIAAEQAARGSFAPLEPQAVPVPEWLAAPADTLAALATGPLVVDPVPATVSLPKPLPRRRDLRSTTTAGAHHTLPARRELRDVPAEAPVANPFETRPVAADDTQLLPRRRDLRRGRQLLVLPAAAAALPPVAGDLAVQGEGLARTAGVTEGSRHREAPSTKPSTLTTTVARAGVVSMLVAVGVATIGGGHLGLGSGTPVGDAAANASIDDARVALRNAPLPAPAPDLWRGNFGAIPPKFVSATRGLAVGGAGDAKGVMAGALKDVQAQQAAQDQAAKAAAQAKKAREERANRGEDLPAVSATGVKGIARAMMLSEYGWGDTQFRCLNSLWNRESGWNYRAYNRRSGAAGIPQALPGSKMRSAGADWRTNPATQIEWGLDYIHDRYGTPCGAWSHSERSGWY